ncbi:NmrA family transcriptional regulator [Burkholderia territorii]|uniref:NmrA family NAD(P)-binding protein n=1 Tax=Burkholderia territorii TaxID=1503055 RepID=UPI0007554203|nr:NAD(P)H-binding protein [Burkholderia territorii]KWA21267.1 NmrA family transcriptional regulator [Burkholderia territorii]KWA36312.1 NmrA family transcriptional regulator [Burkholderia territorii]
MYAITGITGQVGGALARTLLAAGRPVRAVARSADRAAPWIARGCDVAVAEMSDAAALTTAFSNADGVFVLLPPCFDPSPGFPETRAVIDAVGAALRAARPRKVVCLSTIGAQATQENLLTQLTMVEHAFDDLPMPVTFLRPAWFVENAAWDVATARDAGVIHSYLQPLDKPVPMVATEDVGRTAAALLQEEWAGTRIVELEGPRRVSPNDLANAFARVLGRPVRAEAVPRNTWAALFDAQGMRHPAPRMRMLDGFNEGWIEFESAREDVVRGEIDADAVLHALVARVA